MSYGENAIIYGEDFPRVGYQFNSDFNLKIGETSFSALEINRDYIVLDIDDGFYSDLNLQDVTINYLGQESVFENEVCVDEPWIKVSFDNPQHEPHNYLNETYGVVSQSNGTFVTVGRLNTETYHFESVTNTQLPEDIRYGNLRAWKNQYMYHYDTSPNVNNFFDLGVL
ncbi:MAG: hypothetical protein ACK5M1_08365 [Xanthomarina gelatinilytica]|uniref:hypothetical protein n=1 Tax=Xanthomarina gelatinilytica TaxID=1137281 RepID=UPI003A89BEEF